jgi:hypothetical protein
MTPRTGTIERARAVEPVVRRLAAAGALILGGLVSACQSDAPAVEARSSTTSTTRAGDGTGAASDDLAGPGGSCVSTSTVGGLRERAFAFDGTVIEVTDEADPRYPEPGVLLPRARFEVHEWFEGGSGATVAVWMQRDVSPGERLLITGEPRWGGDPLDDAIAWECGFTMAWSDADARGWAQAFSG